MSCTRVFSCEAKAVYFRAVALSDMLLLVPNVDAIFMNKPTGVRPTRRLRAMQLIHTLLFYCASAS